MEEKSLAMDLLKDYKKQNKRLFIMWIITFLTLISVTCYVIYLINDIGTIETTTTVEQSDAENNNYIGNDGDIINGTTSKENK